MTSREIREQFFEFFRNKEHRVVPSAPVVPFDDPTLLFTNAGMNQFKDVFLGQGTRDYKRAADTQKCIRVSGKHNDLEEVGHDTYHHTFFEMLGNWSFGDYYKEEAIMWAWELLTDVWKMPKERLWATVYRTDDEAYEIWKTKTDINPDHILHFDEKDNFWEMGETGPCGPCSEIHINVGDDYENPKWVNAGVEDCIEIWNLVFIQYNRDKEGTLHDLPATHVDTGMGFERLCAVLQKGASNYDTDVFMPLINAIEKQSGFKYEKRDDVISMRVIADHVRTLTFAIADGAVPSSDGRGYVLRRILRRAARYGRKLNLNEPFIYGLVQTVVDTMGDVFPEIKANQTNVEKIIKSEEESFNTTLDRGIALFEDLEKKLKADTKTVVSGEDTFKLYDTFGFPFDLTAVMAREKGFSVDEEKFNELMDEQKARARKSTKDKSVGAEFKAENLDGFEVASEKPTLFTGYSSLETEAEVVAVKNEDGNTYVVLDKTSFYVESGGQTDDHGSLMVGETELNINGLAKINNQVIHVAENPNGLEIKNGDKVKVTVNDSRRWDIMRNHSATHLMHTALRNVLGNHVQQSGSYVGPDRLRFDFTHFSKVSNEELEQIEKLVNEKIRASIEVDHHLDTPFEKAKEMGALMFFGDKYGDKVNVVQVGDYSMEFCGGTHVKNTSQIGYFKIVTESSIASGVRRIEAVTGAGVEGFIKEQEVRSEKLEIRIKELTEEKKKLEKELAGIQLQSKLGGIDDVVANPVDVKGVNVFKGKVDVSNMDELKSMGDELRDKMKSGAGVLISQIEDKVGIVTVVSDDLLKDKKLMAGKIVGDLAKIVGGGGGGRPHLATAGGKDVSKIDEALEKVEEIIGGFLS